MANIEKTYPTLPHFVKWGQTLNAFPGKGFCNLLVYQLPTPDRGQHGEVI